MKTLEELINLIQNNMPSLSNLPVYIIIGAIITILLATIFTRHRWLKFIPGIIAVVVGIYQGLEAWEFFTDDGMLDQAWMAIIYFVSGIVSICLALILHMYIKKPAKKVKKKETTRANQRPNTNSDQKQRNTTRKDPTNLNNHQDYTRVIDRKDIDNKRNTQNLSNENK